MKDRAEIEKAIAAHFERHRLGAVAGTENPWPQRIPLGTPTKAELAAHPQSYALTIDELSQWVSRAPIVLEHAARRAGGALHDIPTHAIVANIDDAAAICGRNAKADLARARQRRNLLEEQLPQVDPQDETADTCAAGSHRTCAIEPASETVLCILKATDAWDDVDFDLLIQAIRWFSAHDAAGLTPRQVPLSGFSAKWLDSAGKRTLIEKAVGHPLNLVDRPRSIEFAYLDPLYLESGARRFDSYTQGDSYTLPYVPETVVIVENKDTFLAFPPVMRGICLFGSGRAGATLVPFIPWLAEVGNVYYWGDLDADGFEILDAYRAAGISAKSLLMDTRTYTRYEPYGTNLSARNASLASRAEKPLAHLTDDERAVYRLITSPACPGHRRIEQERIPFSELDAILADPK